MSAFVVHGENGNGPVPIAEIDDADGKHRLAVDARVSSEAVNFVGEINLDKENDEVTVYGGIDGDDTADGAHRKVLNISSTGVLRSEFPNAVSSSNSNTTPLGIAGTFTGTFEDVLRYGSVAITAYADQAGTLYLDWSSDGTHVDQTVTIPVALGGASASAAVAARYLRVRYLNGAVGQTAFRLQTLYRGNDGGLGAVVAGLQTANALVPSVYDTINLTYTGANLTGVVYKLGTVTISTLTLSYSGSTLTSVVRT